MKNVCWKDRVIDAVKLLLEVASNARSFPEIELRASPARTPSTTRTADTEDEKGNGNQLSPSRGRERAS